MIGAVQDLDLKLLRVFRVVARHGGFVAAQTELGSSLSTISNQIKQLEERCGVRLCDRGALGFRLTAQGAGIIKATEALFEALDTFRVQAAELAVSPVAEISIGVVDSLATDPNCRLAEAVHAIYRRMPGAAVRFFIDTPSELESQVLGGALDFAVGLFPQAPATLESTVLFEEEHALYCASGHPLFAQPDVTAKDIQAVPYAGWSYLEDYLAKSDSRFVASAGTPFMDGMIYLVLSGEYVGFLPVHYADKWMRAGRLRQLLGEKGFRRGSVTLLSRVSQRSHKLLNLCRQEIVGAHLELNGS